MVHREVFHAANLATSCSSGCHGYHTNDLCLTEETLLLNEHLVVNTRPENNKDTEFVLRHAKMGLMPRLLLVCYHLHQA
ncbi:hypothetical protein DPMN_121132 [Dreissena polymorpha]|uniref:Uncharacterized protein n=1 Tax=Dreissena polymorpha TaxID=45954 RepID=A0A9D4GLK2_DREPO|nr:hypothetical protein DPMN_121132 [Dreissena polymorpha]